jgi:hypothetical protein
MNVSATGSFQKSLLSVIYMKFNHGYFNLNGIPFHVTLKSGFDTVGKLRWIYFLYLCTGTTILSTAHSKGRCT